MTDYNDGKWHGWNGGECPVDPQAEVRIWDANSQMDITLPAERVHWTFSGTFRVVTSAPPKPREWWMFHTGGMDGFKVFDYEDYARRELVGSGLSDRPIIHVIEKLP